MSDARRVWFWFWWLWRGHGLALTAIVVLSLVNAAFVVLMPWLWGEAINAVKGPEPVETVSELVGWMLAAGVSYAVIYFVLQSCRSAMNSILQWRARRRILRHLLSADPVQLSRWSTGDLVTRLVDDAGEKLGWFLCSGVFRAVEAALIGVACLSAMAWENPRLALIVAIPLPLLVVGQWAVQSMLRARFQAVQASISSINHQVTTTFTQIRIVQAARLQPAMRGRFSEGARAQQAAEVSVARVQQGLMLLYGFGWQAALVVLLWFGGQEVMSGHLSLGSYVAFEGYVTTLIWPMFDLGRFVSTFQQSAVTLKRLDEVMAMAPRVQATSADLSVPSLELDNVRVEAHDGTVLVEGISFAVEPGEMVGVVGGVGSGKSTVLRAIAGLVGTAAGSVKISGVPVADLRAASVGRELAWVSQQPTLLSVSLRDNILLGREIEDADVDSALETSQLASDLEQLDDGLDTLIGDRGTTLSGGQQQRTAVARALTGKPSILLLDDATAALDAATESRFWAALASSTPITTVVVSHRPQTLARADHIVVLEEGRVVQAGSPAELAAVPGAYRTLYGASQKGENHGS